VKNIVLLSLIVGTLLWAVDPWVGEIDVGPWWVKDNESLYMDSLRGICVINDSQVWVVGENGQVWYRTGGLHSHTWYSKTISGASNYHLNDVFFVNSSHGWIVGEYKHDSSTHDTLRYRGVIYKTTSGGNSWFPHWIPE